MSTIKGKYQPLAAKYIDGIDIHTLDSDEMNQLVEEWLAGLDVLQTLPNKRTTAATSLVTAFNTVLLDQFTKVDPKDKMAISWAKSRISIYQHICQKLEKTDDSDILLEALMIKPTVDEETPTENSNAF